MKMAHTIANPTATKNTCKGGKKTRDKVIKDNSTSDPEDPSSDDKDDLFSDDKGDAEGGDGDSNDDDDPDYDFNEGQRSVMVDLFLRLLRFSLAAARHVVLDKQIDEVDELSELTNMHCKNVIKNTRRVPIAAAGP